MPTTFIQRMAAMKLESTNSRQNDSGGRLYKLPYSNQISYRETALFIPHKTENSMHNILTTTDSEFRRPTSSFLFQEVYD